MAADYFTINMANYALVELIKFYIMCPYDVIYWLAVVGFN